MDSLDRSTTARYSNSSSSTSFGSVALSSFQELKPAISCCSVWCDPTGCCRQRQGKRHGPRGSKPVALVSLLTASSTLCFKSRCRSRITEDDMLVRLPKVPCCMNSIIGAGLHCGPSYKTDTFRMNISWATGIAVHGRILKPLPYHAGCAIAESTMVTHAGPQTAILRHLRPMTSRTSAAMLGG